jgi:hypothetical protein
MDAALARAYQKIGEQEMQLVALEAQHEADLDVVRALVASIKRAGVDYESIATAIEATDE